MKGMILSLILRLFSGLTNWLFSIGVVSDNDKVNCRGCTHWLLSHSCLGIPLLWMLFLVWVSFFPLSNCWPLSKMERKRWLLMKLLKKGAYICMSRSPGPISSFCLIESLFGDEIDRIVDNRTGMFLLICSFVALYVFFCSRVNWFANSSLLIPVCYPLFWSNSQCSKLILI